VKTSLAADWFGERREGMVKTWVKRSREPAATREDSVEEDGGESQEQHVAPREVGSGSV
jgi:hypothetical protein